MSFALDKLQEVISLIQVDKTKESKQDILDMLNRYMQEQQNQILDSRIIIEEEDSLVEQPIKIEQIQVNQRLQNEVLKGQLQEAVQGLKENDVLHEESQQEAAQNQIKLTNQQDKVYQVSQSSVEQKMLQKEKQLIDPIQQLDSYCETEIVKSKKDENMVSQLPVEDQILDKEKKNEMSILLLSEDQLFEKESIFQNINQRIQDGKIKIIKNQDITQPEHILKRAIQKPTKSQTVNKQAQKRKQSCKQIKKKPKRQATKKHQSNKEPENETLKVIKSANKSIQKPKNDDQLKEDIKQKEAQIQQNQQTNVKNNIDFQKSDNFNIGLTKIEKIKIEMISIQLKHQLNENETNFKLAAAQIDKTAQDEFQLIGYAKIDNKAIPFMQKQPFFIQKENLPMKAQIQFEQQLNKNNISENQLLMNQQILLSYQDAALVQKTLHKLQQQFNKQQKKQK